jgi:peptidyl-prolyl cis-trans isomerase C
MITGGKHSALLGACIFAVLSACAPEPDLPIAAPVVVRVGDRDVTADEFRTRAKRLLRSGERSADTLGMDAKRGLLDDIIAQELIVQEALRRGLGGDSLIADQVGRLEQRALIDTLYARQATQAHYDFTQAQIEAHYRRNGFNQKFLSEQIVCPSADSARQALAELRGGKTFAELVPRYSLPRIRSRFGEDGNIGWYLMADMLPTLRTPMRAMDIGSVTPEPVQSRLGYHIFRLNGRRTVPLDSVRSVVLKQLRSQAQEQDRLRYINALRQRYQLTAHADALSALHTLPGNAKVWPGEDAGVFTWEGGAYTCRQYMALHRLGRVLHPSSLNATQLHKLVDNLAGQQIMKAEARRLGYAQLEAIRTPVERKRSQLLATALYRLQGRSIAAAVTEAQIDAYLLDKHHDADEPLDLKAVSPVVRGRVRRLLSRAQIERAMDELIAELRTQYRDRIRIDDEVLAAIVLVR